MPRLSRFSSHSIVQRANQTPEPRPLAQTALSSAAPQAGHVAGATVPLSWSWRCSGRGRWRAHTETGCHSDWDRKDTGWDGVSEEARACDRRRCQDPHPAMSARLGAHTLPTTPFGPKARPAAAIPVGTQPSPDQQGPEVVNHREGIRAFRRDDLCPTPDLGAEFQAWSQTTSCGLPDVLVRGQQGGSEGELNPRIPKAQGGLTPLSHQGGRLSPEQRGTWA